MTERRKNMLLLTATVVLTLLVCEIGLRLWHHVPLLQLNNRRGGGETNNLRSDIRYDSLLGWSVKDHLDTPRVHTVEHGIRRNSPAQARPRPDGILVVGASFTWGGEVVDGEAWPAQLEAMIDLPVDNAAVPAFAVDQIVMRAEQLLPVMRPRLLLLGFTRLSIDWNGLALHTMPKPYFTVDRGELSVHNVPVPTFREADPFEPLIGALAYSHVLDRVMDRLDPGGFYSRLVPAPNDPVDVSCRLLRRLKLKADEQGLAVGVVTEIGRNEVLGSDRPPAPLTSVEECARGAGYRVISTFDGFKQASVADFERFRTLYLAGGYPHYSPRGNRLVAEIVAGALKSEPLPPAH
jgi:hypothetical protein